MERKKRELEEKIENEVLKYLKKERFFFENNLWKQTKTLREEYAKSILNKQREDLNKENKRKEEKEKLSERGIENLLKEFKKRTDENIKFNIYNYLIGRIAQENNILLEPTGYNLPNNQNEEIIILKEKEAEFFVFIFKFYGNVYGDCYIPEKIFNEAKEFLNITDQLDKLQSEKILMKDGNKIKSQIRFKNRALIFRNSEIEEKIFSRITYFRVNEKIRETEEKILKSNKKIEKGKIDTVSLLGIFVAIISIIYANISVSISNELSSIVITNISTVVCILFLLGFIEKSIKNENNKIPIVVIWGISLFTSLILIIGMYSYMRYEKNNFIKYMENIYELKNKETTLELQHFTMPSDY